MARPAASAADRETQARLLDVARRLARAFGRPRRGRSRPLDVLVETVLSQNTSDVNSGRAFRSLRAAFPTWTAAARARPEALERAIRVGGLARIKSLRILAILGALRGRSLRGLGALPMAEAAERLESLPGVGPKTRACVLLFAYGRPAFPVDTHIHRITRRLGLVPAGASAEATQARLEPATPAAHALGLHLNLIRLGRELCRPQRPRCELCPLREVCPSSS